MIVTAESKEEALRQKLRGDIISRKASTIKRAPINWIWKNRLAKGKLTLLGGDPAMGKSQIALDMIARITTGTAWCDGTGVAPEGNCIILSAEDASDDTICPRLDAAGANDDRVHIISAVRWNGHNRSFNLKEDLELLEQKIKEIGNVVLIMIDPITAYLGDQIDSHQTTAVRAILEPLAHFAEEQQIAILGITHPPKAQQQKAIQNFTGSFAFVAAARIALLAIEDVEYPDDRKLLLGVKNNIGKLPDGIGYSIEEATTKDGIETVHIEWDNEPVEVTANEAIHAARASNNPSKMKIGEEFLTNYLRNKVSAPAKEILAEGVRQGISERTLKSAKKNAGIISERMNGFAGDGTWIWRLRF